MRVEQIVFVMTCVLLQRGTDRNEDPGADQGEVVASCEVPLFIHASCKVPLKYPPFSAHSGSSNSLFGGSGLLVLVFKMEA